MRFYGVSMVLSWWMVLMMIARTSPLVVGQSAAAPSKEIDCPLNFTVLDLYPYVAEKVKDTKSGQENQCAAARGGLEMVLTVYLRDTGFFLPPTGSAGPCYQAYQQQLVKQGVSSSLNLTDSCLLREMQLERETDYCQGILSLDDWNQKVPQSEIDKLNSSCSGSLLSTTSCGACNTANVGVISTVQRLGFSNMTVGCRNFTTAYTAGVINIPGPLDPGTALCLLYISTLGGSSSKAYVLYITIAVGVILLLSVIGAAAFYYRHRRQEAAKKLARQEQMKSVGSHTSGVTLFTLEELNEATGNFSRENLLGTGGYANVYKGTLHDGTVVAVKRFKNCSPAGDKDFLHEVEIISSVRHKHLVGIRGCCVHYGIGVRDGHQHLIVFDCMPNGTLHDHLFKKGGEVLDWPTRMRIAIGMAKGLAYLHFDALPSIIHRDIKPSNILLDSENNARLGDFGLAKFSPDGVSHLTTNVAGTYGYVAPEYAFYGQLTNKSDVYSFGMVLLELVTGRRALLPGSEDHPPTLLSDHVWPLVKQGNWKSVIDPAMTDVGPDEVMERFILVALLCAHPQMYYRPNIDQALNMLESDVPMPEIPDRPLPLTSNMAEIEAAVASGHGGSAYSSSSMSMRVVDSVRTSSGSSAVLTTIPQSTTSDFTSPPL